MMIGVLDWLACPSNGRGVYFADDDSDGWTFCGYGELAERALAVASWLNERSSPGDVICLAIPSANTFVRTFFGVLAAGATVCPLPPRAVGQSGDAHVTHLAGILRDAAPALVLTTATTEDDVAAAMVRAGVPGRPITRIPDRHPASAVTENEGDALLQYTSASTGRPKGVRVSRVNLTANTEMIRDWLDWGPHDAVASWLPLHHDMGLIGCMVTPVAAQSDLWLMRPDQFVRRPARWLGRFGSGHATITAAPPFGYGYAAARTTAADLAGMDFSGWRVAIVGAEPVAPDALRRLSWLLRPRGFVPSTFRPAYGLAEATLAVTGTSPGRPPTLVRANLEDLGADARVTITETAPLGADDDEPARSLEADGWLVGSGLPLRGTDVRIRSMTDGGFLPEDHLGEIVVSGPSVARGYRGGATGGSTVFDGQRLHTGDAGFLHDGELFVIGRIADSLKIRGRTVYVEDLEARIAGRLDIGRGRLAAVSITSRGRQGVALLAELEPGPWVAEAAGLLRAAVGAEPRLMVISGRRGLIRRGTSGKPRRRHIWQELQSGRLGGAVLLDEPGRRSDEDVSS